MKHTEDIEELVERSYLNNLQVPADAEMDERILGDAVARMQESSKTRSAEPSIWRIIMKSRMTRLTAAAVVVLVIVIGIVEFGEPGGGANAVFAAAMDSVRQARTFSCTEITERPYKDEDGQERGNFLFKQRWMFKEPDWERHEMPKSPWGKVQNEVTITHYGRRQRLRLKPVEKKAILHDMSSDYTVDDKTGEVRLTRLRTGLRDRLLKTSAGAVDDLGKAALDGKSIRVLRSRKGKRLTTVWIDPETNHPVKIEHKWADQSRSSLTYAGIQIDTELDNKLFSLEPPEGYTVKLTGALYSDEREKMAARIMHVGKLCLFHWNNDDKAFPDDLGDLVTTGITSDAVLKKLLAAPNDPDGPPVIRYCRPDTKAPDWGTEVMLYEVRREGTGDGRVMVVMLDSHGVLMPVQTLAQFLKPWPEHKKKLSVSMTRLHWFCDRYAKEHGGEYPAKLADITGADIWEDTIKRLQAPWSKPDAPAVIRYRPPRAEAELSSEVVFHEICDQWPDDGAVVCYADGNCEIIREQNQFEELTK